jgi:uncharacterized membrane protein (DUF485 family)
MPVAHPSRRAGGALRFWLFGLYLIAYLAFMILTAFDRPLMASTPFGGANLAVISGFALIAGAIVLALLYWWLCRGGRADAGPATPVEARR